MASSLAPRLLQAATTPVIKPPRASGDATRRVSSRALLGESASLVIDHEGVSYVLRATRLGKLILTK